MIWCEFEIEIENSSQMALWSVSKPYYYVSHDTNNCTKTVQPVLQLTILQMEPDNSIQFEQKSQCVSKHVAAVSRIIILNYIV